MNSKNRAFSSSVITEDEDCSNRSSSVICGGDSSTKEIVDVAAATADRELSIESSSEGLLTTVVKVGDEIEEAES